MIDIDLRKESRQRQREWVECEEALARLGKWGVDISARGEVEPAVTSFKMKQKGDAMKLALNRLIERMGW